MVAECSCSTVFRGITNRCSISSLRFALLQYSKSARPLQLLIEGLRSVPSSLRPLNPLSPSNRNIPLPLARQRRPPTFHRQRNSLPQVSRQNSAELMKTFESAGCLITVSFHGVPSLGWVRDAKRPHRSTTAFLVQARSTKWSSPSKWNCCGTLLPLAYSPRRRRSARRRWHFTRRAAATLRGCSFIVSCPFNVLRLRPVSFERP